MWLKNVPLLQQRAALQFPYGEIALEQRDNVEETKEVEKVLSVDGILKTPLLNGVGTVVYNGKDLSLRYIYKVIASQFAFIILVFLLARLYYSIFGKILLSHQCSVLLSNLNSLLGCKVVIHPMCQSTYK